MRFDADNSGEISKTELVTFLKQALDIHLTVKEEKVGGQGCICMFRYTYIWVCVYVRERALEVLLACPSPPSYPI